MWSHRFLFEALDAFFKFLGEIGYPIRPLVRDGFTFKPFGAYFQRLFCPPRAVDLA